MTKVRYLLSVLWIVGCGNGDGNTGGGFSGIGQGGSTATFAIVDDHLYLLGWRARRTETRWEASPTVRVFSLTEPGDPQAAGALAIARSSPETLVTDGQRLFAGTETGMLIIDITEPTYPQELSFLSHLRSCDPVVTSGEMAYLTLRSNNGRCAGSTNELHSIDISHPESPKTLGVLKMTSPWGLATQGSLVYVCDGIRGLRIVDVSDPRQMREIGGIEQDFCFDVIASGPTLLTTGGSGIIQYRTDDPAQPMALSRIELSTTVNGD